MDKEALVQFYDVSKSFKDKVVLKNSAFSLHAQEMIGLVGPSGSGKSTVLRLLLGLTSPDSVSIKYSAQFKSISFASQDYSFYPLLSVEENVEYFGAMHGLSKEAILSRSKELLTLVGLQRAIKTRAKDLSGGMKRRLDLALALLSHPSILLVDEPTTGLDIILKESIWKLLHKIHSSGRTILISSHDLAEIQTYCTDVVFLFEQSLVRRKDLLLKLELPTKTDIEKIFHQVQHHE